MKRKLLTILAMLPIGLGMLVSGCGKKPSVSTSTIEATVSGIVTIDGKAVTEGEVSFDPSNYLRKNETARTAPIGPDGTYSIRTLVGHNSVQVATPQLASRTGSASDRTAAEPQSRHASMTSGFKLLEFEAKAGDNTFNIELQQAATDSGR